MNFSDARWIMAFDASCGTCRKITAMVAGASDNRLEFMPLSNVEVQGWREKALGVRAPFAPTLLSVSSGRVRGWVGIRMVMPLVRCLGIRSSVQVVRALGQLRRKAHGDVDHVGSDGTPAGMGRKQFLQLGSGALIAAGLVLTGKVLFTQAGSIAEDGVRAWIAKNKDRLPTSLSEVASYPAVYQRAIFGELSPFQKSRLWVERFDHYRVSNPNLSASQTRLLERAAALASRESAFAGLPDELRHRQLESLRREAERVFSPDEARTLLTTFGTSGDSSTTLRSAGRSYCNCAIHSDWCNRRYEGGGYCSVSGGCRWKRGCGVMVSYDCDGQCRQTPYPPPRPR